MLPRELVRSLPQGGKVVEVGVGGRSELLAVIRSERPDLELVATDVRPEALEGVPADALVDDIFDPAEAVYEGACLLVAVRCPEELQAPLARVAARVRALLAINALKDEWAELTPILGRPTLSRGPTGTPWRVWEPATAPR